MDMQPWVHYPYYTAYEDGVYQGAAGQLFPFRSFAMIMSFVSLILVSILTHYLFVVRGLKKFDFRIITLHRMYVVKYILIQS